MGGESSARVIGRLLGCYPADCQPSSVEFLGNAGGFSGAQFWKLTSPRGTLCVRRWPPAHPSAEQLAQIHEVLVLAKNRGCDFIPVPIPSINGDRFVRMGGLLCELAPWLPGVSDLAASGSMAKLNAALHALAIFHDATSNSQFPGNSQGLRDRHKVTVELLEHDLRQLQQCVHESVPKRSNYKQCRMILQLATPHIPALREMLENTMSAELQLQPCLRDIWHDHFLFSDDTVTGLIDFGAMRIDTPACDLARLLGSLARYHKDVWSTGLTAYQQVRSLATEEVQLIKVFHQANTVLSGLNWVRWLMLERRLFENNSGVEQRLDDILWGLRSIGHNGGFLAT